jgi:hypothetical protein
VAETKEQKEMPIPLGRSLSEPNLLAWQIIYMQAVFFLILGSTTVSIQAFRASFGGSPTLAGQDGSLPVSVHVRLVDLFAVSPQMPGLAFLASHALAAVLVSVPLARCVQRRRFVSDFVATCYAIYFVMAWVVTASFPTSLAWWVSLVFGAGVTFLLASHICSKRELQEVELSGGGAAGGLTLDATATGAGLTGRNASGP